MGDSKAGSGLADIQFTTIEEVRHMGLYLMGGLGEDYMPLPKPRRGEKRTDFISRFMSAMADEYPDTKQRLAIAHNQWDKKGQKKNGRKV